MEQTARWGMYFIAQNQAQKEVTVNHTIAKIDCLLGGSVLSRKARQMPVAPRDGMLYIAPTGSLSDWEQILPEITNHDLLLYQGAWQIIKPQVGMLLWLTDENALIVFTNGLWQTLLKLPQTQ